VTVIIDSIALVWLSRAGEANRISLRWPEWTLAWAFAVYDSTINIGLVLFFRPRDG